jgi:hypothetical protein
LRAFLLPFVTVIFLGFRFGCRYGADGDFLDEEKNMHSLASDESGLALD